MKLFISDNNVAQRQRDQPLRDEKPQFVSLGGLSSLDAILVRS